MINVTGLKTLVKKAKTFEIKNRAFAQLTKLVPREDITYLVSPDNKERDCFYENEHGKDVWIRNSYYDLIHIKGAGVIPVLALQELLGDEYRKYCKGIKMDYRKKYCLPGDIYYPLCDLAREILDRDEDLTQREMFKEFYNVFRKVRKKFILPLEEIPFEWNSFSETFYDWKKNREEEKKKKLEEKLKACSECECKNCNDKFCANCNKCNVGERKETGECFHKYLTRLFS